MQNLSSIFEDAKSSFTKRCNRSASIFSALLIGAGMPAALAENPYNKKEVTAKAAVMQDFRTKSEALLGRLDHESYAVREQASAEMLELLLFTETRVNPVPAADLAQIGVGKSPVRQLTPEQAYRIKVIEKSIEKIRSIRSDLFLSDYTCSGALKALEERYGIKAKAPFTFKRPLDLHATDGIFTFSELVAAVCKATSSIPKYENSSKRQINFQKIPEKTATYFSTEFGLFVLVQKSNADIEIHFLSDPKTDFLTYENLESAQNFNISIFNGRGCVNCMDGKVSLSGGVRLDQNQFTDKPGEISLKIWVTHSPVTEKVSFSLGKEFNIGEYSYTFSNGIGDDPFQSSVAIKAFPAVSWSTSNWRFDAMTTLSAGTSSFKFYDAKGVAIDYKDGQAALSSRTIIQPLNFAREPSTVEISNPSAIKRYALRFSNQTGVWGMNCSLSIENILPADGSMQSQTFPTNLDLAPSQN